jgi:chaperonin cofactor prefoldin
MRKTANTSPIALSQTWKDDVVKSLSTRIDETNRRIDAINKRIDAVQTAPL